MGKLKSDIALLNTSDNKLVGKQIINLSHVESTMDEAKNLAICGAREGLVVIADRQSKGRGRFNRKWLTTPGQDVTISILLKPVFSQLHMLNMIASLAIKETIFKITQEEAEIKWPNDVLFKGKKVSGILIETAMSNSTQVDFAVVGIGLNVNLDPADEESIKDSATSIGLITHDTIDKYLVLTTLLSLIDKRYQLVLQGKDLCSEWSSKLSTIGTTVKVSNGKNIILGYALGVDSVGNLIIETNKEKITVSSGDVTLI